MREMLRALLRQDAALVVEDAPPASAGARVVAHVVVGERASAEALARAVGVQVPVVVVSPDARWAGRVVGGRLVESSEEPSPEQIRALVVG